MQRSNKRGLIYLAGYEWGKFEEAVGNEAADVCVSVPSRSLSLDWPRDEGVRRINIFKSPREQAARLRKLLKKKETVVTWRKSRVQLAKKGPGDLPQVLGSARSGMSQE